MGVVAFFFWAVTSVFSEKVSFEFIDQKYGDILYALSSYRGISIVADDTVSGTACFQFAGTDFEKAFESFLCINRLYVSKKESVWTISRIAVDSIKEKNKILLDALDATPAQIFDKISRNTGKTILFDVLPSTKISIHISANSPEEIVSLVMKPFTTFTVENTSTHIFIKRIADQAQNTSTVSRMNLEHTGNVYTTEINQARTSEVLERLCKEENIEYSNFIKNDPVLSGIRVTKKTFNELIDIILEQAGSECIKKNEVYYFVNSTNSDSTKLVRESDYKWKEFKTHSIRGKDAANLLSTRFPLLLVVPLVGTDGFLAHVNDDKTKEIHEYLSLIDQSPQNEIIYLKYISTSDFLKSLPPSVKKEELTETGTGNSFFYSGPDILKEKFLSELKEIDKPKERIRYDMLIVQYENSSNLSWGANTEIRQLLPGDRNMVSGNFGSLLNLNFDVITLFGYKFSEHLNTALAENSAHIFADTTLHGISGENIKFQNTSTYRYRDSNVDPETGKPVYTGITREIVSGVVLEINGWVSGDGMVTMNIHASVSKRGADVSSKSGNPPPTSEKIITTKLNTSNGEPVILSGLTQNDSSIVEQRIPFISKIPLIGLLFRNIESTKEKTEMIIYIVPHITNEETAENGISIIEKSAYERLVAPFIGEEEK